MALTTLLRRPRSALHGSGAHFWAGPIPIAACGYRLNSRRKTQHCSAFWLCILIPHIRSHFAVDSQPPIIDGHLAEGFLPARVRFPQRVLECIRIELYPNRILVWSRGGCLPIFQGNLKCALIGVTDFDGVTRILACPLSLFLSQWSKVVNHGSHLTSGDHSGSARCAVR
jgi:hypothetical protein